MSQKSMRTCLIVCAVLILAVPAAWAQLTPMEQLGKSIYFDTDLASPNNMSCATCHTPEAGYADPDIGTPTSLGVVDSRYGNRNSPSSAYAAFIPPFGFDDFAQVYFGGQFWDGRAMTLEDQAKGPFLNPLEMANPNATAVVTDVVSSAYGDLFLELIGLTRIEVLADVPGAFDFIASAIATYERSTELNRFNSRFDRFLAGQVALTSLEALGLELYEGKAGCAACHPARPSDDGTPPVMSTFVYHNLGVPGNPANLFLTVPRTFNPDGTAYIDYGLGGRLDDDAQLGKFRTMTLRNIAMSPPYMHNGVLQTLDEVVDFMNSRDLGNWPAPEVALNVSTAVGDLGLTVHERKALVAFLLTFSDGPLVKSGDPDETMASAAGLTLDQNRPNPFNPLTEIAFATERDGFVQVGVYDIRGRIVDVLVDEFVAAGPHSVIWNAADNPSGVYFCRVDAGSAVAIRKMVLLK